MIKTMHCPSCLSEGIELLYRRNIRPDTLGWGEFFRLVDHPPFIKYVYICRQCGLVFMNPRYEPHELDQLYHKAVGSELPEEMIRKYYYRRSQDIERMVCKNSRFIFEDKLILDFGGNYGEISHYFSDHNTCLVFDYMSPRQVRKNLNIVDHIDNRTNFIMFNHVLEHVSNPHQTLANVVENLESSFLIYIELPFELSHYYLFRTVGHYEHINIFSRFTLAHIARSLRLTTLYNGYMDAFGGHFLCLVALLTNDPKQFATRAHCDAVYPSPFIDAIHPFNVSRVVWNKLFSMLKKRYYG